MTRRPGILRPFSREYEAATSVPVTRMFDGPYREYVSAGYVAYIEAELTRARENARR